MGLFNRKVTLAAPVEDTTDTEGGLVLDPDQVKALADALGVDPTGLDAGALVELITRWVVEASDGTTELSAADLDTLRHDAHEGAKALAELKRRDAAEMVGTAVREGRILAVHGDRWINDALTDYEGTRVALSAMPAGRIPVSEKGRGGSDEERETMAGGGWVR